MHKSRAGWLDPILFLLSPNVFSLAIWTLDSSQFVTKTRLF